MTRYIFMAVCCLMFATPSSATAEQNLESPPPVGMNNDGIAAVLDKLDIDVVGESGRWQFRMAERNVLIVTDEAADRMRVIVPVMPADALSEEQLRRVMQANFDTALDARYAIAKNILWSAFIHPLGALDEQQLLLGIGQTVNLANTFGDSYTSGLMVFQGGDSSGIRERELLQQLIDKGLAI